MDTLDLNKMLKHNKIFLGTFPCDMLPKNVQYPLGIIVNTDTSTQPGSHWVAIFINSKGHGYYFDSFGLPPLQTAIKHFLNKNCIKGWCYNTFTLQDVTSDTCGIYAALYLEVRFQGHSHTKFLTLFSHDNKHNDYIAPWIYLLCRMV